MQFLSPRAWSILEPIDGFQHGQGLGVVVEMLSNPFDLLKTI